MLPKLRTVALAGALALGGLLLAGGREARAQLVIATPRATVGLGVPALGVYPGYGYGYGAYPGYAYPPTYGVYSVRPAPVVVAPAPVVVPAYPRYYGGYGYGYGRYYGGYPGRYGYRRW